MRLNINLATRPYEDARQFWQQWGGGVTALGLLTVILLYVVLFQWLEAREASRLIRQGQEQIAALDNQKAADQALLNRPENRSTRDRSQFLNDLFQRKSFSWTQVFEELERVMPPRLHVVSIKPEMTPENQLQLSLSVAGESRERALDLVRRMEGSRHFQQTQIRSETQYSGGNPGDNVQFDIRALYVPETAFAAARRSP